MSEAAAAGKGGEEREREREMRGGRLRGGQAPRGEGGGGFSAKMTAGVFLQNCRRSRIFSSLC